MPKNKYFTVALSLQYMHIDMNTERDETYNIHYTQNVVFDVFATMVSHHHFVCYYQRFHKPFKAYWSLLSTMTT